MIVALLFLAVFTAGIIKMIYDVQQAKKNPDFYTDKFDN